MPFEKLQKLVVSPTSPVKAPVFAIVIHEKGGSERREIFETTEISVGRVQGNDLMLPKGNVSKRHARMLYRDGRFIVTDLNSTNGTYVNRRRITQATIVREGDRIYIGDFVLRIETPGPAAEHSIQVNANSVPPQARPPLPTSNDSQSGALLRSAFEDDEEHTRSAPRGTAPKSSPAGAPEPPAGAGRSTQDDEELSGSFERELVAALVDRVSRSFSSEKLEGNVSPELADRFDHALREAWASLGAERGSATQLPSERVVAAARAELVDLGPLGELLEDPSVTEIAIVGCDRITVVRNGKSSITDIGFSSDVTLRWAAQRLCSRAGLAAGETGARECRLGDGTSISAVVPANGPVMLLVRKPRRLNGSLDELVRRGTVSRAVATFLQQCLVARVNILIVGPRDGGAEVLLGALAAAVPEKELVYAGDFETGGAKGVQRLRLEGSSEDVAHAVSLAARAPTLRLAVELGSPEVTEAVVAAIADGADGVIALRSASSLARGLLRVRADLSGRTEGAARAMLAGTFEVVVEVARLRDDRHRVLRVAEIVDSTEATLELADVFTFVMDRTAAGGMIEGSFVPAASMPAIADMLRSRGATIDNSLFSRPPSR